MIVALSDQQLEDRFVEDRRAEFPSTIGQPEEDVLRLGFRRGLAQGRALGREAGIREQKNRVFAALGIVP